MNGSWLKYDRRVPRYTSYPTAPHFDAGVDAAVYRRWLSMLPADMSASLYFHIPFCNSLCWFCGCHTKAVRRYRPVADYVELLKEEISRVAAAIGRRQTVRHLHWGGGTPTLVAPGDILALMEHVRAEFDVSDRAEFAVEIDPRGLGRDSVHALAAAGVTRASLGVQDIDPDVQAAINRVQPLEATERTIDELRDAGIRSINVDLMYGLPHQTVKRVCATADAMARLGPERLAVFGYAHVPWMKRHQSLIDEATLPDADERLRQSTAVAERLTGHGYVRIGLDHFSRPDDPLAVAQREGRLHRNFQGYTADDCSALIGFGASAIGSLPQGYVQNAATGDLWRDAISRGDLAVSRGVALSQDDHLRRAVIERLMCDFQVDLGAVAQAHGRDATEFAAELQSLARFRDDGLIEIDRDRIELRVPARPFVRTVCAVFDRYLKAEETQHARAV